MLRSEEREHGGREEPKKKIINGIKMEQRSRRREEKLQTQEARSSREGKHVRREKRKVNRGDRSQSPNTRFRLSRHAYPEHSNFQNCIPLKATNFLFLLPVRRGNAAVGLCFLIVEQDVLVTARRGAVRSRRPFPVWLWPRLITRP